MPGAMQAGANKSVMLEFQVPEVDQQYARLKRLNIGIDWVMPPTTFPWGTAPSLATGRQHGRISTAW